jgi:hypothetical protein
VRKFSFILFLLSVISAAAADKIREAIDKGLVTKEFVNTLTPEDVPAKWCTTISTNTTATYIQKTFARGGQRRLEVMWRKDWVGAKSNMFTATIFDGHKRIGKFINLGETTHIPAPKDSRQFDFATSIKNDGAVSIVITSDTGVFEVIHVKGRDSHLTDDLEFTRTSLLMDGFAKPMVDAMKEKLEEKAK